MRAADLIDGLMARVSGAFDEEQLWRYKYETLSHQNDELETECESLRHDIERHVKLSSFIITERDTLKTTLQGREAELLELGDTLKQAQEALKGEQTLKRAGRPRRNRRRMNSPWPSFVQASIRSVSR